MVNLPQPIHPSTSRRLPLMYLSKHDEQDEACDTHACRTYALPNVVSASIGMVASNLAATFALRVDEGAVVSSK